METEAVTVEDSGCDVHGNLDFDKNEKNTIRVLEQALEEDEAMAMILLLEICSPNHTLFINSHTDKK